MSQLNPPKYKHLPPGTQQLIYLGNFFLRPDQGWKLAAYLQNQQGQISSHSFRIEALPDLRIGQMFLDGTPKPESAAQSFRVPLPELNEWRTDVAGKAIPPRLWPLFNKSELCQQKIFVFTQGHREYVIPVLEFARALLFHKKAVCKSILMPNGFDELALIRKDTPMPREAEIRFRSDAPLYLLDNIETRQHLIWMMLHQEPSRLFNSIYQKMITQQNQNKTSRYKRFTFDMEAPDHAGVRLEYAGPIFGNTVFVREILGFSGLPDSGYKAWLFHPRKKKAVDASSAVKGGQTLSLPVPENLEIDEQDDDTTTSSRARFSDVRPVAIAFVKEPETELILKDNCQTSQGNKTDIRPFDLTGTSTGGLGDPCKGSKLEPVEYGQIASSKEDNRGGLALFTMVARELARNNRWRVSMDYYELPCVCLSQFRMLGDRPRMAGLATFYLPHGLTKHLLEVQISDGRYLSTLLLSSQIPTPREVWQEKVSILLWALVKGAGQWKSNLLRGITYKLQPLEVSKIRHPKKLHEKSKKEACGVWIEKLQKYLE